MEKYKNPNLSVEARVQDLLSKMTLEEKFQQLHCPGCVIPFEEHYENAKKGVNSVHSSIYWFKALDITLINKLQKFCVEQTRLGIPLLVAAEGTHGISLPMTTIFPTTGCIAATFDEKYAYEMGKAEAKEARAMGFNQLYAPNVDLLRDPRWGRSEENFGEDPYLSSKMGEQVVKGIQEEGVCATVKHYLAYGSPESGLNLSSVSMGEREIREYMLKPFRACVQAGAMGIMPGYNEIDGVPIHASKYWLNDVLREELGFDGLVITDYGAAGLLYAHHNAVEDMLDLGKTFLAAGVDLEACGMDAFGVELKEAVEKGEVPVEQIDRAVSRILTVKFKLGLFENPYFDEDTAFQKVFTAENRSLCREIEEKGAVLLKNDGVLPLKKSKLKKIALLGPNAEIAQLGDYCYYSARDKDKTVDCVADKAITLKQALIEKYGAENVLCENGCGFAEYDEARAKQALQIASEADVVIFAGGHNSIALSGGDAGGEEQRNRVADCAVTSGEGYDTADTDLTKPQKRLLQELRKAGKPVVLVLYGGKPVSLQEEIDGLNAVLLAFGVGTDGNNAVADILEGDVCPSGRLPFSMPRSVGHLPCYYNHKYQGKGSLYQKAGSYENPGMDYVFDDPSPLFSFGHGLSYTQFAYSPLTVEESDGKYRLRLIVSNVGEMDGEESVLVFARNTRQKLVTPIVKRLVAYQRVAVAVGQSVDVEFVLSKEDFSYIGIDMQETLPRGEVKLFVGERETTIVVEE